MDPELQHNVNTHQTLGAPPKKQTNKHTQHTNTEDEFTLNVRQGQDTQIHIKDEHRDVAGVDVVLLALEHHSGSII